MIYPENKPAPDLSGLADYLKQGVKHDGEKVRWDLMPLDALKEVAHILTFGARKYADRNWEKGILYGRLYRAATGHLNDWFQAKMDGNDGSDPETGRSHLAHAACCVLFLLAFELRGMKAFDNRPELLRSQESDPYLTPQNK